MPPRRAPFVLLSVVGVWGHVATARAHGSLPATTSIAPRVGSTTDIALGTNFGPLLSRDGGKTWKYVCEEAMGYLSGIRPTLAWLRDGTILVAAFDVMAVSTDGGCSWSAHPFFAVRGASDVTIDPRDDRRVFATSQRFGADNGVFRSQDGGKTFAAVGATSAELFFTTVRIAPSDPQRIYAAAYWDDPARGVLYRSDDGGDTFTTRESGLDTRGGFFVLAVDPTDPDVLYAAADDGLESNLHRSQDGGTTWKSVLLTTDVLRGAMLAPDGQTVLVAGNGRIFRSTDRGLTFGELAQPQGNACVARIGDETWACGYTRIDGWALARSADYGDSWQGIFAIEDIAGVIDCPAGSQTHDICGDIWPLVEAVIARPRADGGAARPDAGAPDDGGAPPEDAAPEASPSPPRGSGCGCRIGGAAVASPAPAVAIGAAFAVGLRRRRPRCPGARQDAAAGPAAAGLACEGQAP